MKLHKLMYFTQREALIQIGEPLFNATFYGWKYGPVLKEIKGLSSEESFTIVGELSDDCSQIIKNVMKKYAQKDSMGLSRLTRGEISWKNSRIDIPEGENSDNPMKLEDIELDAERTKNRRRVLKDLRLLRESCI